MYPTSEEPEWQGGRRGDQPLRLGVCIDNEEVRRHTLDCATQLAWECVLCDDHTALQAEVRKGAEVLLIWHSPPAQDGIAIVERLYEDLATHDVYTILVVPYRTLMVLPPSVLHKPIMWMYYPFPWQELSARAQRYVPMNRRGVRLRGQALAWLEREPASAEAHLLLAQALELLADTPGAEAERQKARELGGGAPDS